MLVVSIQDRRHAQGNCIDIVTLDVPRFEVVASHTCVFSQEYAGVQYNDGVGMTACANFGETGPQRMFTNTFYITGPAEVIGHSTVNSILKVSESV